MATKRVFQKLQRQFERLDTRAGDLRVDYESPRSLQAAVSSLSQMARSARRPNRARFALAAERARAIVDATQGTGQVIVSGGPDDPEGRAAVASEVRNLVVELAIEMRVVSESASFDQAMKAVLRQVNRQRRKEAGRVTFTLKRPCKALAKLSGDWALRAHRLKTLAARESVRARRKTIARAHLSETRVTSEPVRQSPARRGSATTWDKVTIRVLSDHSVQVLINGEGLQPMTYAEMGFEDRRTQKPNLAWMMLLELARHNGVISKAPSSRTWSKVEKQIQALRKQRCNTLQIAGNPLPFIQGTGYQASFLIELLPALDPSELL